VPFLFGNLVLERAFWIFFGVKSAVLLWNIGILALAPQVSKFLGSKLKGRWVLINRGVDSGISAKIRYIGSWRSLRIFCPAGSCFCSARSSSSRFGWKKKLNLSQKKIKKNCITKTIKFSPFKTDPTVLNPINSVLKHSHFYGETSTYVKVGKYILNRGLCANIHFKSKNLKSSAADPSRSEIVNLRLSRKPLEILKMLLTVKNVHTPILIWIDSFLMNSNFLW